MDKNIAAIVRKDTKTVVVSFGGPKNYVYVTNLELQVGDVVVVKSTSGFSTATVTEVHDDLQIEPDSDTKYIWVVAKVDFTTYDATQLENATIEAQVSKAYQGNLRRTYRQQVLSGLSSEDLLSLPPSVKD